MYERNDLTPPDSKDREYTDCEWCKATGWIYETGEDGEPCKEDCPECGGKGYIEIED